MDGRKGMPADAETAPAKVNLTLQIRGRRADGYHLLDSLVAFADCADRLAFTPGRRLGVTVAGSWAPATGVEADTVRPREQPQRRRGIGRSAAEPCRDRQVLFQREMSALQAGNPCGEGRRRPHHEIVGLGPRRGCP